MWQWTDLQKINERQVWIQVLSVVQIVTIIGLALAGKASFKTENWDDLNFWGSIF